MSQQLDPIDTIATKAFEGYVVRKDLVRKFKGQYPVPTYVAEFLLGRYCASVDENEIAEGLKIVERQLGEKTIRAGEHELFKARAKDKGHVKLIDIITARLDAGTDSFLATLPSLQLKDVRIGEEMVHANERMLTGGFYAEVELAYDPTIAQENNGRPFGIESLREIQLSKREVLPALYKGREAFATEEWKDFLIRSIGMEPEQLTPRARDMVLLRMVPFVERNYNMVELGPRGTGKSHLFQQVSPYAHLISGGKATVARMFVNNANGQRGLVCQYDVVCFDEISGVSFDQKDGVNIMKGYMESGEFSRGKESIRCAEQNLYARAKELVGDRDPRAHEFSVQLRAFDASKSGAAVGIGVLLSLCSALLQKSLKGGLVVAGGLNLGGSLEPIYNAVNVAELAVEKGAATLLIPVSARKQMNDLSDDMVTKINIQYFTDAKDALIKSLAD